MLSTSPRSRRRLVAGGALVSTLVLAGLGLTASGTSAAAALTGRVGDTIGMDLQAAQPAPPAPPAPAMASMPPMPAMPPVPPVVEGPTKAKRVVVKRVAKDGTVSIFTSGDDGRFDDRDVQAMVDRSLKNTPQVSERRCADGRDGGPQQIVVNSKHGDRRVMVICTNRIEAMASDAARTAANAQDIRRNAMQTALASVQASRADIAANRDMPAEDRAKALAEMDEALAELRIEMASPDKD